MRKIALSGVAILVLTLIGFAATVPVVVHKNAVGVDEDSLGVVLIDKDTGNPYNASASGGGGGGDATAANQVTANTKLDTLHTDNTTSLARFPAALGGTTSANSLPVVLSSDGPFATQTGSITETAPASDTASAGLNGRAQRIAQNITTLTGKLPAALGAGGGLKVDGSGTALPVSGTVAATESGTWTVQPGNTANTTPWLVTLIPSASGGSSTYSGNITTAGSGAGVGGVAVDASPGQIYGYAVYNANATVCYLGFYDQTQALTNLGTTVPKMAIGIPAGGGANLAFPNGVPFATAITISATTTRAGSTACGSGLDTNVWYR